MERIVLTCALGNPWDAECALGLGRSLRLLSDPIHRVIVTDQPDFPWKPAFDEVIIRSSGVEPGLECDELEADAVLLIAPFAIAYGRVYTYFEQLKGCGLARDERTLVRYAERGASCFPIQIEGCACASTSKLHPSIRLGTDAPNLYLYDSLASRGRHRRELKTLAWLEAYEARTEYGEVTNAVKWRRSIEKRILRRQGRI